MKLKGDAGSPEIQISHEELLVLNAALNEVCNGIELFEFETRIGAPRAKVEQLMAEIRTALDQIEKEKGS